MATYKLLNALPNSLPGSEEFHYGFKCQVKQDGIYIELDDLTAQNFHNAGRIAAIPKFKEEVKQPEKVASNFDEIKPQSMTDVIENGVQPKRGRPSKGE